MPAAVVLAAAPTRAAVVLAAEEVEAVAPAAASGPVSPGRLGVGAGRGRGGIRGVRSERRGHERAGEGERKRRRC